MAQPLKFYFDFLNQSSRALYIFLEASKIPFEAIPISMLKESMQATATTTATATTLWRLKTPIQPIRSDALYAVEVNIGFYCLWGLNRNVPISSYYRIIMAELFNYSLSSLSSLFPFHPPEPASPLDWVPFRSLGRSRIDEYLAWQQTNMGVACTDYFQQKWLVPYLQKTRPAENAVNVAGKQLEHTLNDFEQLFLNSRKFMLGNNISFADLSAICEIDQPKSIGFNAFQNRNKLARWYEAVRDELGPYYKDVHAEFEAKLKQSSGSSSQGQQGVAQALKQ
ncbi:GL26999 [Drosophila persimilis]|uniref:GL26999 n=1 Tax=Drosophila persimilis TaxID=7234 RepID=B4H7D6_DROPE|nr:GL26999 [Drosophila persimilis]